MRAQALAKRRRLVLLGVLAAVVAVAGLVVLTGGGGRSVRCREYDAARSQYDKAVSSAVDPADPEVTRLHDEVERLRVACES